MAISTAAAEFVMRGVKRRPGLHPGMAGHALRCVIRVTGITRIPDQRRIGFLNMRRSHTVAGLATDPPIFRLRPVGAAMGRLREYLPDFFMAFQTGFCSDGHRIGWWSAGGCPRRHKQHQNRSENPPGRWTLTVFYHTPSLDVFASRLPF
jgi:hypothetical protein